MSPEWIWIGLEPCLEIHRRQIADHGGDGGLRDRGLVESALNRPQDRFAYGDPEPGPATLAAAYVFGLVKNHGFVDGNKRTAWVVARTFLKRNGWDLVAEPTDAVGIVEGVAAGSVGEDELAEWFGIRLIQT